MDRSPTARGRPRKFVERIALSVVLALFGPLVAAVTAPAAGAQALTFGYTIEQRGGVTSDLDVFRYIAAATLTDRRGWSLGGSIAFTEVTDDPDLRLVLATPAEVDAARARPPISSGSSG